MADVPLVLQHQAEARLHTFAAWFAPGLTPWEDPYARRTHVELEDDGGRRWRPCKRPINLWRALAAHIAAGAQGEAQPYQDDGRAQVTAIGLSFHGAEVTRVLNLDLDGVAYDPAAVVAGLVGAVGSRRFLITSGSGRPGRYRVLLPIEPQPVREVQAQAAALLGALGFPLVKGGVEVYPATTNGRLPFGAGGCSSFDAGLTGAGVRMHPYALLDRLTALPPVDLAAAVRGPAPAPLRARPRLALEPVAVGEPVRMSVGEHGQAARAMLAVLAPPAAPPPGPPPSPLPPLRSTPDPARLEAQLAALIAAPPPDPHQRPEKSTRFGPLWVHGVPGVGHRDAALYRLARDSLYRRRPPARAVQQIQRWIAGGGLARSEAIRLGGDKRVQREIADVGRRVAIVYRTHPHPHRPAPKHLSARELLEVGALASRRAAVTGVPAARIAALLYEVLPIFKGCAHAGLVGARMHCREWDRHGGRRYKALRDAAGIFEPLSGYVSQATLRELHRNPADAYARTWGAHFSFDPVPVPAPRRRLGGSYGAAKLAAQLAEGRTARRTATAAKRADEAQGTPRWAATESTHRNLSGTYPLDEHTQTSPPSAALLLPESAPDRPASGPDRSQGPLPPPSSTRRRDPPVRLPGQIPLRLPAPSPRRTSPFRARRRLLRAHDPDP